MSSMALTRAAGGISPSKVLYDSEGQPRSVLVMIEDWHRLCDLGDAWTEAAPGDKSPGGISLPVISDPEEGDAKFRLLIERSSQGILIHRDGAPLYANQALAEIFGFASVEAILALERVIQLFAPEEWDRITHYRTARLAGRPTPEDYEIKGLKRDGSEFWLNNRSFRCAWDDGPAICTALFDITVQVAARRKADLLCEAMDGCSDMVVLYDRDERLVFTNDRYHEIYPDSPPKDEITNYSQEDLLRRSLEVGQINLPEAKTDPEAWIARRLAERRGVKEEIGETQHSNGRTYLYRHKRTSEGGTIVLQTEITERKKAEEALRESEQRFKDFAEATSDWFWEQDADLQFVSASPEVYAKSGVTAHDHIGKTRRDIVSIGVSEEQWRQHDADLAARRPFRDFAFQRHDPSGELRDFIISGRPVFDAEGEFKGYRGVGRDITERKRAEEALQKGETLFRSFIDNLPAQIFVKDTTGRFTLVNRAWEKNQGVSGKEATGKTVYDIFPEDKADIFAAQDQAVLETGQVYDRELELRRGNRRLFLHTIKFPISDADGEVTAIGGIATDITEHKRAEEALRESERRYRDLFDHAVVGIYRTTPDGRHLDVNPALARMRGCDTSAEFMAHFLDARHPIYVNPAAREEMTRLMREQGYVIEFESESYRRDGTRFWMSETGRAVRDETGQLIAYEGFIVDITEHKQAQRKFRLSEQRLRAFLDSSPDAVSLKDTDGRYLLCNKEFERLTGFSLDRLQGKTDLEVFPLDKEIRSEVEAQERKVMGSKRVIREEREFAGADDTIRSFAITKFPVFDLDGNVTGIGTTNQDITEHRRAEEQLRQSQKMEAVGQLTAGVAHDFNNMLAVIWGNAELLEDELGEDHRQLGNVFRATKRAADLTHRLLAFSRKQVLNPEIINVNSLISDITGLLRRTLEEHIDIEAVTAARLWNCEVDPAQLENALVNLAINARDAMPEGGKLTIETANARLDDDYAAAQAKVRPGQYVMLAVTDTGTGMPPEVRERVFEPFFTTKEAGKGTGLGLSMIYGFVKQSGGHVTIYSESGEGTTIKLYLPRSTETEAVERKPVTGGVPIARGETVLVVEDDTDLRTLAVTLLGNLGYQVMEAGAAAAALEELESTTRVNLLLTDVMLPGGMNGRELAVEAERRAPGIKVLYMSGYTEDAIAHHGRLDADAALLQKPFRRVDLARAVRRVLDDSSDLANGPQPG